jgi:hypothetical protein
VKPLLIALALARAIDAASTCDSLRRSARETNPLMGGSCKGAVIMTSVITGVQTELLVSLHKRSKRAAIWIAVGSIALEGFVIQHNLKVGR